MTGDLYGAMDAHNANIRKAQERSTQGWEQSPFSWIRQQPSRRVGAIGEDFSRKILEQHGLRVAQALSSEHDFRCQDKRVENKFSTLWETGVYKFQQIRDQDYDVALLLGLSPHVAHMWCIPKQALMSAWSRGDLVGQHGGSGAKETAWLEVRPGAPPAWMAAYGPDIMTALRYFQR